MINFASMIGLSIFIDR